MEEWNGYCPKCKSDNVDWADSKDCESEHWSCLDCKHQFILRVETNRFMEV